jgi:DNA polymerase III delta prime subunit
MHAYLITGGSQEKRFQEATRIINEYKSSTLRIIEINPEKGKKTINIEEIRKLKKSLSVKASTREQVFVIIQDSHLLNLQSQNALLKLLEEPPSRIKFILCAPNHELLLQTIVSRCANIKLEMNDRVHTNFNGFKNNAEVLDFFSENKMFATDLENALVFCDEAEKYYSKTHNHQSQAILKNLYQYKKHLWGNGISTKLVLENIFLIY